jgi:hypothetical protein
VLSLGGPPRLCAVFEVVPVAEAGQWQAPEGASLDQLSTSMPPLPSGNAAAASSGPCGCGKPKSCSD